MIKFFCLVCLKLHLESLVTSVIAAVQDVLPSQKFFTTKTDWALLNIDCEILAKILSLRLQRVMPSIISLDKQALH